MPNIKLGFVDRSEFVFIPDPASTDGSGKTGLVAANLTVSYSRMETDNDATVTDVTSSLNDLAALTTAHTDWGLKEVSSTLAPGLYRLDLADAVFASGAWSAVVYVMITTSAAAASPMRFDLIAYDELDGVRLGLTALPNAAADAAGGLPISDAGGLDLDARLDVAVSSRLAPTTAGRTLDVSTGGEAGIDWANIGSPTTAQNLSATNIDVDQVVASVSGAVGSVTGAVGSVTGLTAATVHADLDDIQARLPAALTAGGKIKASMDEILAVGQSATDLKDFADDGYDPSTNKVQGVVLTDTVTTYTGNTPQTGDSFARLGAPAGASVSADIAAIEAQTDDIGVAGAGLTAVPWNAAWDAEVQSEVEDGLIAHRLDELLNADSDIDGAAPPTVGSVFHELMTKTAGSFTYDQTTDSLEAVRDRGDAAWADSGTPPTAAAIADAVWEEAIADHSGTAGSTAEQLAAAGAAGDPWTTALPGAYGAGTAGQIVGDNLNATVSSRAPESGGNVAAIKAKTDSFAFTTAGKVDARAFTVDDKTGYALTSAYDPAKTASQAGDAMALTSGERSTLSAALLDLSNAIETGVTLRGAQRLMLAALAGKLSGANTATTTIRNAVADSKDRIIATTDATGRTAVTTDMT